MASFPTVLAKFLLGILIVVCLPIIVIHQSPGAHCLEERTLAKYDREVLDVLCVSRVFVDMAGGVVVVSTDQVLRSSSTMKETVLHYMKTTISEAARWSCAMTDTFTSSCQGLFMAYLSILHYFMLVVCLHWCKKQKVSTFGMYWKGSVQSENN